MSMNAAVFDQFGSPDVLRVDTLPLPEVPPGHVRIKVLAAGLNRLDHYVRNGDVLAADAIGKPHVAGADAAGEVESFADDVTGFEVGERVFPMPGYPTDPADADVRPLSIAPSYRILGAASDQGTYAQYLTVPARWVLKDPTGLAAPEAATLPLVLVTAVRSVKVVGEVKDGDTVLVHAGASGSGSMAIQVARALGARVLATVRRRDKAAFVESLGAERVIVTDEEDFVAISQEQNGGAGVDVVIDNLGGDVLARSVEAIRPGGIVVSMGFVVGATTNLDVVSLFFTNKQVRGTLMGDREDLEWGLEQVATGKIRPLLDRALPWL